MDLTQLSKVVKEKCGLQPEKTILVGVSGGADSLCLCEALLQTGYRVVVGHFNHHLRPEADQEMEEVQKYARSRNIICVVGGAKVAELAAEAGKGLEESAREARYQFLFAKAAELQAQAVAVGHTADDQVETVLMHILRGSGLAGLKGMDYRTESSEWSSAIPLVRPLLAVWREETEAFCRESGLEYQVDPSNLETSYRRNQIRLELIPLLQNYNPQIKYRLWVMAESLGEDWRALEMAVGEAFQSAELKRGEDYICFSTSKLQAVPDGILRGILRKGMAELRGSQRDLAADTIRRGVEFIRSTNQTSSEQLSQGLELYLEDEYLYLMDEDSRLDDVGWPQIDESPMELPLDGSISICPGWVLTSRTGRSEEFTDWLEEISPWKAWLDLDKIGGPLTVCANRPGERFEPLGMGGRSQKVSDFWINQGMPRRARARWPLVYAGNKILWIPGYRPAHFCRIQPDTQRILYLSLRRQG